VDDYAQVARTCQDCVSGIVGACGPKSPDSHRVVWGLTSRPPVSPAGFPPVSRLPAGSLPFVRLLLVSLVRRSPVRSLRPLPGFRFPLGFPPGSLPLSNLHVSAAVRRFRRRWSRAAGTKVTSPAATTSPGSRDPPALQMGSGWARWDVATESPVTSGRERRTSPRPNRPDNLRRVGARLSRVLRAAGSHGSSGYDLAAAPQGRIFIHCRFRGDCPLMPRVVRPGPACCSCFRGRMPHRRAPRATTSGALSGPVIPNRPGVDPQARRPRHHTE
jgi:hypothetical protein